MGPQADLIKLYRDAGGDRPVQGGIKACWAPDEAQARSTMHQLWPNDSIPERRRSSCRCRGTSGNSPSLSPKTWSRRGPDPEPFVQAVRAYEEAGFDEVYPGRVGGRLDGAFEFFATQVLPRVRES